MGGFWDSAGLISLVIVILYIMKKIFDYRDIHHTIWLEEDKNVEKLNRK